MLFKNDDLCVCVEHSWSNDYYLGLKGWILGKEGAIDKISINIDGSSIFVDHFYERHDVINNITDYYPESKCGFQVQIPRKAKHYPVLTARINEKSVSCLLEISGSTPIVPLYNDAGGLFSTFQKIVNDGKLNVLEIGSRIVSPGSSSKRNLFARATSYTGFDYYPDSNTDVVGDAHKLSSYFESQFDAIFSISVLEHLAMPWKVSMEINRLLKVGGFTFHATHFAWPLHDQPWDFWRFSDNGLASIFSKPLGFEVVDCGYWGPLRMHLDSPGKGQELFPFSAGFGGVGILAKKISDYDESRIKWDIDIEAVVNNTHYPLQK